MIIIKGKNKKRMKNKILAWNNFEIWCSNILVQAKKEIQNNRIHWWFSRQYQKSDRKLIVSWFMIQKSTHLVEKSEPNQLILSSSNLVRQGKKICATHRSARVKAWEPLMLFPVCTNYNLSLRVIHVIPFWWKLLVSFHFL